MGERPDDSATPIALSAPEPHCANCGAAAPAAYCPECGQSTRERLPTFAQFMREASGRYVALDGRLWKTIVALLFRPGYLSREYFAGRRRRYIGPARLFLVASLLLFAVLRFATESIEAGDATSDGAQDKHVVRIERGEGIALDDELNIDMGKLPPTLGPLGKRIERFNRLSRPQKIEQIVAGAIRYGPYAMFVLLPAFALLLEMLYLGRRRRNPSRPRLYGEHLVFAAHNHAYVFAALALLLVVPSGLVRGVIAGWMLIYLPWSVRAVYGGSWIGIIARAFVLVPSYAILFGLVTGGLLIAAVLLR